MGERSDGYRGALRVGDAVLSLQAAVGNAAVLRLLADQSHSGAALRDRAQITVSRPSTPTPRLGARVADGCSHAIVQTKPSRRAADYPEWDQARTARRMRHLHNQHSLYESLASPSDWLDIEQVPGLPIARDLLLKNTRQYIRKRLVFSAMTPTLSTDLLPPREFERFWGYAPDEAYQDQLFFDDNTAFPTYGASSKSIDGLNTSDPGVVVRPGQETAHQDGMTIRVFMDRELDAAALHSVIVHEIQHHADRHGDAFMESVIQDVSGQYGDVANRYRSEFRAYWLGDSARGFGDPNAPPRNDRVVWDWPWNSLWTRSWPTYSPRFQNARQEGIFWHMCNSRVYPWVAPNIIESAAFRAVVEGLAAPTGGNLINSVRIQDLQNTLGQASQAGFDHWITDVLDDARALDDDDKQFLRSNEAAPFWTFWDRCFSVDPAAGLTPMAVPGLKRQTEQIIGRPPRV